MVHLVLPLMIAGALPFALTLSTKLKGFGARENHATRQWQAALTGWRQRAYWAHQNAFETYPLFAAAVIVAFMAQPTGTVPIALAWAYPALRIAYSLCYIFDKAHLRSLVWFASIGCILGLFVVALGA